MSLEYAILGFLDAQPMTGYDLKTRCFDADAAHFWTADQAQIYRTLERLSRSGQVSVELVPQPGKPDRKVFAATSAGRKALRAWLAQPKDVPSVRDSWLLQLFFSAALPDEALTSLLSSAREGYQGRLDHLRGVATSRLNAWIRETGRVRDGELRRMALTATVSATRTTIDWIDDCIERIAAGIPGDGAGSPAPQSE